MLRVPRSTTSPATTRTTFINGRASGMLATASFNPSISSSRHRPSLSSSSSSLTPLLANITLNPFASSSITELLCGLKKGDVVELTQAMGKGFEIDQIEPLENYPTVLIFVKGYGTSPIGFLIESGFNPDKRSDVKLFYGVRNLDNMAYQDRFKDWEASGVKRVPILSQPQGIMNFYRTITWQWLPFTNSAQKDDLKLYHWSVHGCYRYTDEEYEKYLTDPVDVDKEGRDHLFDLCQQFDLRFIVMADRFPSSRIVEELIEWIPV